jgi:alanine racemase
MDLNRIYAKIDLGAIAHNIKTIKNKIGESKLMLVVKADGYGHGAVAVAREFESEADYFAVAEMREALELRRGGVKKPLLILGYTPPSQHRMAIENDVTLTVFTYENAHALSQTAQALGKNAAVHFAVDTGMGRIGFRADSGGIEEALASARLPGIFVEGIFSHFATADSDDTEFADGQRRDFEAFVSAMEAEGVHIPIKHMNNSAGILAFDKQFDMVRAGILTYGLYPSECVKARFEKEYPLRPAMELVTYVSHVKELDAGCPISYGSTYVTERKTLVATVPVGYADGYPRALSGRGEVLVRGVRCPILGRVCMDQMMVDVSRVPNVKVEDRVILVGRDGEDFISAEEVADAAYSFNYEFICGIAKRVPRVHVK